MALIELEGVTKAYYADRSKSSARIALDCLDLSIEEGEFVSLVGPSGCGKTVTLNMIAGFESPTSGEVRFGGEPVVAPGPERGVVFQEYSLLPWLTVAGNIDYALASSGQPKGLRRRARDEALAAVGLSEFAEQRPNVLSGGMKQRVAIARLLAMDSEVLLMDEPFSALDEQTRIVLDQSLSALVHAKRKTAVFVTHSISEAVLISTRIVLYSDTPGRVIGQWSIPSAMDRSAGSAEAEALRQEIVAALPATSCGF